ncbi:MAG TPA: orotate phosphoribosyltransferase [Dehalococcoidia bacterium]|nr:orotate phosphoribosyltransferase [Dehalococcoidia bacterium]
MTPSHPDPLALFREAGAFLEGHFELTSGRHSGQYLEKFALLQWARYTEPLCAMIADRFRDAGVQVVAGPTTGGIILAYEVGRLLGVRGIFAEKNPPEAGEGRSFQRGFRIEPGERVLVVDDILTTGGSIREVLDAVRRAGGDVVGVGVLADRTAGNVDFGVPLYACLSLEVESYPPGDCPLCRAGVPLQKT